MDLQVLILLLSFVALLLLNVPVAVCIGVATVLTMYSLGEVPTAYITAQRVSTGISSFPLLAIPFFILAGVLMGAGGMARRLMDFASALVGGFHNGLSYVNTITCMLFGAVSGSAVAAVSSIGTFMIPEMERAGYKREYSVALTTTSATTGLLIPPSNVMIVYAVVAGNVSIAALFMAGIIPGVLIGLSLMAAAWWTQRGKLTAKPGHATAGEMFRQFLRAIPSIALIFIVLGGILGGVFSATEASAVAALYALILGVVFYREVRIKDLPGILLQSAKTTAIVMFLVGASQAMSWVLSYEMIPQAVSEAMIALSDSPLVILLIINVLLLLVGVFMDMTPAIVIFAPIFLPVVAGFDMHPVHFGIILIANLCIGLCTPPVGTCLFVGCGVGGTTIARVMRPLMPMFLAMLIGLMLITYVPALSLWLPELLGQIKR